MVQQYQLENVTSWEPVDRFNALRGEEGLEKAARRITEVEEKWDEGEKGSALIEVIIHKERLSRDNIEMLRVVDSSMAERVVEILSSPNS